MNTLLQEAELNIRTPATLALLKKWNKELAGRGYATILYSDLDELITIAREKCEYVGSSLTNKASVRRCCLATVIEQEIAPLDMHQTMADDLVSLVMEKPVTEADNLQEAKRTGVEAIAHEHTVLMEKRRATISGYENTRSALQDMSKAAKDSKYPDLWMEGARRAAKEFHDVPPSKKQSVRESKDDMFDVTDEDIATYARVLAGMVKDGETIKTRKQFDQLAAEMFDDDPLNLDPGQRMEVGHKTWELIQKKQKEGKEKNVDWRDLFESHESRIDRLKREMRHLDLAGMIDTTLARQGTFDDGDALDYIDRRITAVADDLIDDFPKEEDNINTAAALYRAIRAKHGKNASKHATKYGNSHVNHELNTRRHELATKIHAAEEEQKTLK